MKDLIPNGVRPTMVTPFTVNKEVNYEVLSVADENQTEYFERGTIE